MDSAAYRIANSDIQFYDRPSLGYQVILFVQRGINRSLQEGKYLGIHSTFFTVIEYRYESPNSYPAATEGGARLQAVTYCMKAAASHWSRMETRLDARIYPSGGMIREMRVVPRKPCVSRMIERLRSERYTPKMLSPLVRFGTSTWTYEGWQGQVYKKQYAKTAFARECLGEYCQYLYNGEPLFRTVGNDATFDRPPTANQFRKYLSQIPEDFEMCFKVWEEITIPVYAKHARYGREAGKPNPHFLNAKLFRDLVLTPYREGKFGGHTGPFLFEFQRHGLSVEEFCSKLNTFFSQVPKEFRYAVEIRNAGLLGATYRDTLERHGVAHVYNHWSYMPSLAEQHWRMERFTASFTVLRLLTPLKMSYEAAKKRAEPYDKIVGELPEMRKDAVTLIQQSVEHVKPAYILVNNRSEGNAPLTIQALTNALQGHQR